MKHTYFFCLDNELFITFVSAEGVDFFGWGINYYLPYFRRGFYENFINVMDV